MQEALEFHKTAEKNNYKREKRVYLSLAAASVLAGFSFNTMR